MFAAVSLVLAALGIYGVTSFAVTQARHEMAIRLAIGADPNRLLWLTVRQGLWMALGGLGLGLAGSFVLTRVLRHLLHGVTATDPLTYVAVSVLLLAVAVFAAYIPARRAARIDPVAALRWE